MRRYRVPVVEQRWMIDGLIGQLVCEEYLCYVSRGSCPVKQIAHLWDRFCSFSKMLLTLEIVLRSVYSLSPHHWRRLAPIPQERYLPWRWSWLPLRLLLRYRRLNQLSKYIATQEAIVGCATTNEVSMSDPIEEWLTRNESDGVFSAEFGRLENIRLDGCHCCNKY